MSHMQLKELHNLVAEAPLGTSMISSNLDCRVIYYKRDGVGRLYGWLNCWVPAKTNGILRDMNDVIEIILLKTKLKEAEEKLESTLERSLNKGVSK